MTCPQCEFTAEQRAGLWRHIRTHSQHQSPTSSADMNDGDDDVDVGTEDVGPATTADENFRDLFCNDCCIQFTSPATYRAHRNFYCKRRAKRDANDVPGGGEEDATVRRRRRASGSRTGVSEQSDTPSDNLRHPTDIRPALFPPSLAPAGLMEMLSAGVAPLPPPPGAFFLAPFLAAAAAAAAAGMPTNGLGSGSAVLQQSPSSLSAGNRTLQPLSADRHSSTSASDDEPLDLSTCRNVTADIQIGKHDSVSPAGAATSPASAVTFSRQFAVPGIDSLDTSSVFLPSSARLPLNANLPLPVVRPPLSSPPSISHCAECNIVFYKHANYLAHKAHYCAGRHGAPSSGSAGAQDQTGRVSGPAGKSATMSKSDDVGRGSTILNDSRRRSPDPHELVATLDDSGTTIQFYCIPCKIKFSSLDTLRAHKQFYCPARFEAPPSSSSGELTTPTRHRHTSRVYGGVEDGERQPGEVAGSSCTACGTRVTSPRSGHRCTATSAVATPSLYQCPHCDYAAQSDSRLVEHVRAHAPSRAFRCALCGYRGNTVRGMRMHGKMHNDEAAAAAGRGGSSVQLPTFTDDCVIEYEEPPAIPPRRHASSSAGSSAGAARPGVDTELLRQKNEPYKRRRSRKAYEKAEYAPTAPTTPVICAECSAPLLDTTHAQAHASAHATERLLAWEALYGGAASIAKTPATAAVPACKADVDVDHQQTTSPVTDETTAKSASLSLLPTVKTEQSDSVEQSTTTDTIVNDDDRKCNGTDRVALDDQKLRQVHDERTSSASPADDVDVTGFPSTRSDADDNEVLVSATTAAVCPVGRHSSPPLTDVGLTTTSRQERSPALPLPGAAAASARRSSSLDVASRYCEQCDITFMYSSTFVAHKKYYCSSHAAERADATARPTAATGVAV